MPVDLMVDLKPLARVEDVRNAEGKSFKGPGKLVLKVLRVRQENRFLAVQVRLEGFEGKYDPNRHRWQARDSVGRPLRIYPYPPNFFESEEGWTGTVAVEAPDGAGPGTTLTLSQFRPARTSVPFSFRDVPLP